MKTPEATRHILNQNEKLNSSRAGSPTTIKAPVTSSTPSAPDSQGPNL